jgi:hypothetical protein
VLTALNLGLRFLLEISAVMSVSVWGFGVGRSRFASLLLGIGTPVVLIAVWAQVVAPGADNPISPTARMLIGTAVLLASAAALGATGRVGLAVAFAGLIVVNTVALLLLDP